MQQTLNGHPRAVIRRVRQFRCGSNTNIELFEYESPDQRSCYFLTPWDMQTELISYPYGKGYEQTTERRLWDPRTLTAQHAGEPSNR